jgi:hypothetical protein
VANSCKENSDCGANGVCTEGACYSKSGKIDEVLLEIVPEASSPLGGMSLLSMQWDLRRGALSRAITLAGPISFQVQVFVNGEDLPQDCPYLKVGKQTVAARVQFTRVGSVGGVSVAGIASTAALTVNTEKDPMGGAYTKAVSLVPGYYDVYAQPAASTNCQIPSKMWRGVEFARDGIVVGSAPPVTLELPRPRVLNGTVTRGTATLANWQVDLVDPRDEKVISTSARLGATSETSPSTNFQIAYQPLDYVVTPAAKAILPGTDGPLIRLKPPKDAESSAPTLYFDLVRTDLNNTGVVDLNLAKVPTSTQLVTVVGQVRGNLNEGVKSTVKFLNSTMQQGPSATFPGLLAAYGPSVMTDGAGRYSINVFPGTYSIVVVPEGATDDGSIAPGANTARSWALTETRQTIGTDAQQTLDLSASQTRILEGVATAGTIHAPAQGATIEATPLASADADVVGTLLNPPVSPARAATPVDDNGKYRLVLDPGYYTFVLKPAQTSNFAWWILPSLHMLTWDDAMGQVGRIDPELLYPVPLGGTISVTMQDKGPQVLRNATVRAYASSGDNVTLVGTARTDDMGRYQLALPPDWGL